MDILFFNLLLPLLCLLLKEVKMNESILLNTLSASLNEWEEIFKVCPGLEFSYFYRKVALSWAWSHRILWKPSFPLFYFFVFLLASQLTPVAHLLPYHLQHACWSFGLSCLVDFSAKKQFCSFQNNSFTKYKVVIAMSDDKLHKPFCAYIRL